MADSDERTSTPVQWPTDESLEIERIITMLRSTAFDIELLTGLTQSMRENLIRRLARVNDNVTYEKEIPGSRIFSALMTLIEEPIAHFDFLTAIKEPVDSTFEAYVQKLSEISYHRLETFKLNVMLDSNWLQSHGLYILRFAGLKELRVPSFILGENDLRILTVALCHLEILDCKIDAEVEAVALAYRLRALEKLRKFYFDVVHQDEYYYWIPFSRANSSLCFPYCRTLVKKLPYLSINGCDLASTAENNQHYPAREIRVCHVLDDYDAEWLSGASRLQHLVIQRAMHPRQAEWHAESAVSLCVVSLHDEEDWTSLRRLRRIKHLYTVDCSPEGRLKERVQGTLRFGARIKKYLLEEDSAFDDRILMTVNPLPASLNEVMELHFSDLPENLDRLVEVMALPNLQCVHVMFHNPEKCKLDEVLNELRSKRGVGPKLKHMEFELLEKLDPRIEELIIELGDFIVLKVKRRVQFRISNPFQRC